MIELAKALIVAFLIALFSNQFLVQVTDVHQSSMRTTLLEGDRLVVSKLSVRLGAVQRGDVVTFQLEGESVAFVKRVIALEGQVVDVRNGVVWVDGVRLIEPYVDSQPTLPGTLALPYTVPAGNIFALGDNRGASNDSRYFGGVPLERLIGVALFRFWPANHVRGSFSQPARTAP